jgi:branched-chain amino acid transport system permease protein
MPIESIAIDALLAMSVFATIRSGKLTLAGAGFMACGAFGASSLAPRVGASIWLCAIASALTGLLLGAVLDRVVRRLAPTSYSIATLSFSLAAPLLMLAPHLTRGPSHPAGNALSAIVCLAAGTAALAWTGERFRFATGAAAAGLAGALYWSTGGALNPNAFGLDRVGVMVAVALIGGAGSPLAPVASAALLAGIARIAAPLTNQRMIVDGVALLVALVYLPDGAWAPLAAAVRAIARLPRRSTDGAS